MFVYIDGYLQIFMNGPLFTNLKTNMSILEKYSFKYCLKCDCQQFDGCKRYHGGLVNDFEPDLVENEWEINHLANLRCTLNGCKSQIGEFPSMHWNRHTDYTEISTGIKEQIIRRFRRKIPPVLTRAWIKFYDILCTFNLINLDSNNVRVMFQCEAPGAFINATNHFIKSRSTKLNFEWIANTLNPYYEQIDTLECISYDTFIREPDCYRNWFFGQSNKGNILEDSYMDSLNDYLKNRFHSKENLIDDDGTFDLITGDGAFDCCHCFDSQEESVFPLIKAEINISLKHLRHGGNLVVKFFTFFNCRTISLLYSLSNCFDKVSCYKPVASKKGNSEIYVICQHFQRLIYVRNWKEKLNHSNDLFIIGRQSIMDKFIEEISNIASTLTNRQIVAINRNIQLYKSMTDKDEKEIKNFKYRLAKRFINEFQLFSIAESDQLAYPSAYTNPSHSHVFIEKLKKFHLF
ncbi:ftsJ methyltransferase domain-containing protein, partial [Euroglyphus maynei]